MLSKLIKYDLRYIYKQLIIFYIIVLFLAVVARLTANINDNFIMRFIHGFAEGATFGFSFGMIVNASMRMWSKYKYSMYGDESYLTHTLPITKRTLWTAKFFTSIIIVTISLLLFLTCLLIMFLSSDLIETIKLHWNDLCPLALAFVFALFCQCCFIMQCGLLGVTIGHRFESHRALFSVIFGLAIYLLGGIIIIGGVQLWAQFNSELHTLLMGGAMEHNLPVLAQLLTGITIAYAVFITASYFTNYHLLKRGVNVD